MLSTKTPLKPFLAGCYTLLTQGQTTPVYDNVPTSPELPCITLGGIKCIPADSKDCAIWEIECDLEVWSRQEGKLETVEIVDDLSVVIGYAKMPLAGYQVLDQTVSNIEIYQEETYGYHGTVTISVVVQEMGGN